MVLGSGGHTAEMLELCRAMDPARYTPATFALAATDRLSQARAEDTLLSTVWAAHRDGCRFRRIPRAREVGQSWVSTVFTTALACCHALYIVATARPELILVNGPVRTLAHTPLPRSPLTVLMSLAVRRGRAYRCASLRLAWRCSVCSAGPGSSTSSRSAAWSTSR